MDLGLSGRTFVVSGASRGLGYAVARALHEEGASVVLAARDPGPLEDAADRLGHGRAFPVAVDLADPSAGDLIADAALSRTGRLDGGVCNTGGPSPGSAVDTDDAVWRGAFESAFLGPLRLARDLSQRLDAGGALLFILSTSVKAPISGLDTSNGLRPGLAMLVKSLADQLGPRGVRVNAVLPGRFATARSLQLDQATADPAVTRARSEAAIPLRRYGEPDELGRVGAFLLSPAASYVTGASVPVDGGSTRAL
ncbi:MAG TPA: SDR family oxidoreductase [Frankiaceae bacterium]|nr:SDR family oxidoreductase [Frankiaceae bacterium]